MVSSEKAPIILAALSSEWYKLSRCSSRKVYSKGLSAEDHLEDHCSSMNSSVEAMFSGLILTCILRRRAGFMYIASVTISLCKE